MYKKLNSMPKKVVSIFMALFIIILSAPFVFAAEPITLTEANITTFPTYEGSIYFGQKISDGITITGGEVQYDGKVVPGHFEIVNVNEYPMSDGTNQTLYKFIPDDTNTYSEFTIEEWGNAYFNSSYNVIATTPKLVDENNMPVAANKVVAGKKLSTCKLSGGSTIYNPYYPEEPNALEAVWKWSKSSTVVKESGFYEARIFALGYENITTMVWVNIEGDDTQPVYPAEIIEKPAIAEITYDPDNTATYDTLLQGGKAVIKGTDTEVEGKFTVGELYVGRKPVPTDRIVEVVFTPADPTVASWVSFEIPVTVNHAPLAFKDAEGNIITEDFVFEVEPNEKMSNIQSLIWVALIAPEKSIVKVEDYYGYAVNGKTYKLTVEHENNYYEGANEVNELYFTVKFKETELDSVRFFSIGEGKWKVDCGTYSLPGVFTVYAILGETETKIGEVKSNQTLEWMPSSSGDYTFRVEYTPAEDDYFIVNKVTTYSLKHQPNRYFTATGSETTPFHMGETVKVVAPATDPTMAEEPYYGFVGWTVVSGNPNLSEEQLANEELSFAMPDENVELKATYKFSHELYFKWVWQQIVEAFQFVISAFKELFGLVFVV